MKTFYLCEAEGHGVGRDAYIDGDPELDMIFEEEWEGLSEWLEENIKGKYSFDREYENDFMGIRIQLTLTFYDDVDATAFKLYWL